MFKLDDGAIVDRADDAFQNDGDEGDDSPGEVLWEAIRTELARQIKDAGGPDDSLEEQLRALLASHKAMAEAGEEMPSDETVAACLAKHDCVGWGPGLSLIVREQYLKAACAVLAPFRPIIARLRRERDTAEMFRRAEVVKREGAEKALAEVQRERDEARAMARHHANETIAERGAKSRYTVNVDTGEAQAKLEALLASAREYEATLDRALAKTQALAAQSVTPPNRRWIVEMRDEHGLRHGVNVPANTRGEACEAARARWPGHVILESVDLGCCSDPANIGIGDPPPKPPPPPPSVADARVCKHCGAVDGDGRDGCIETFPPKHEWGTA